MLKQLCSSDACSNWETNLFQVPSKNKEALTIGIFHSLVDFKIAERFVEKLQRLDYQPECCDFFQAGVPKTETLNDFISSHDVCVWVATKSSLSESLMTSARHIAQHDAVTTRNPSTHFITFQPAEALSLELPKILEAFSPLLEDEFLEKRLASTFNRFELLKKKSNRRCARRQGCMANPTSDQDIITESSPANLNARPDRRDCTEQDSTVGDSTRNECVITAGGEQNTTTTSLHDRGQVVINNYNISDAGNVSV